MFENAMLHVLPLVEARQLLANRMKKTALLPERIPLSDCFGRILAKDVAADEDLPPFDRSAVDGYALPSRDTFGASAALPALLHLAGEVKMGERAQISLRSGECAVVYTGGELPCGADAMAMLEELVTKAKAQGKPNAAAERALAMARDLVTIPNAGGLRSTEILPSPDRIPAIRKAVNAAIVQLGGK